jgi:hypothetical protein
MITEIGNGELDNTSERYKRGVERARSIYDD